MSKPKTSLNRQTDHISVRVFRSTSFTKFKSLHEIFIINRKLYFTFYLYSDFWYLPYFASCTKKIPKCIYIWQLYGQIRRACPNIGIRFLATTQHLLNYLMNFSWYILRLLSIELSSSPEPTTGLKITLQSSHESFYNIWSWNR